MHIVNAMFGKNLGGIEQAFLDYCCALNEQGHHVTALIHPDAAIMKGLAEIAAGTDMTIHSIANRGYWDILAIHRMRRFLNREKPDAVITHGSRAAVLLKKASRRIAPVIGVAHHYGIKRLAGLDGIIAVTSDLRQRIIEAGQRPESVYHIPNMIHCVESGFPDPSPYHAPPVIGTMGRFVEKKGFHRLIEALALLERKGLKFEAVIGGAGSEYETLRQLADTLGLKEKVRFPGWINDKSEFFRSIDIFCLPSLHEPFGIVLLEAFSHGKPVITTDTEGPSEIVTDKKDALLVPKNNPEAVADALEILLKNPPMAAAIGVNGRQTVTTRYARHAIGRRIQETLEAVTRDFFNVRS